MVGQFKCSLCRRVVATAQGLKSHNTRVHKGFTNSSSSQTLVKSLDHNEVSEPRTENGVIKDTNPLLSETFSAEKPLVELLANYKSSLSTLRRIPKGVRSSAADALADTIETCLHSNTPKAWERLLLFPAMCFIVPNQRDDRQFSLATMVKQNISGFMDGRLPPMIETKPHRASYPRKGSSLSRSVVAKLSDGDVSGAVRILCSEDSLALGSDETVAALKILHPSQEGDLYPPILDENALPSPLRIKEEAVKAAIASFPAGSSGGLDLLRPQHLKDLVGHSAGVAGSRLIGSLTRLCNVMLSGNVPEVICSVLYGASLCALKKKDGGIRPIAVGCTYRRLVAKMACHHISTILGASLQPVQLGFGVKGGAEAASHAARRYTSHLHVGPRVLMKVDFRNAFNMVRRDVILQAVMNQLPGIYRPSHLSFGEKIIPSQRGIHQGDPLGPALFCLAVQPLAKSLKSEFNVWYLDDATLGGALDTVIRDFEAPQQGSAELGLEVNTSKCELFWLDEGSVSTPPLGACIREKLPSVKFPSSNECCLLGSPLTESSLEGCLLSKIDSLKRMSDRLSDLPVHCAFYILKNALAIPKLAYVLRCAPTWKNENSLACYDSTLKGTLESIMNVSLSNKAWEQSSWPVSDGGLGVRRAGDLSLASFLSSIYSTSNLVRSILPAEIGNTGDPLIQESLSVWCNQFEMHPPSVEDRCHQRSWETPRVTSSIKTLREQAENSKDKARLLGVASKESGAFLNALPSAPLGTLLSDDSFRIAVALRLGSVICQPHTCPCGSLVDSSGTHGLSCKMSRGRHSRHATVNDIIKRALTSAGVPSILEPPYLVRDNNKRPDGITQIPWRCGKYLVWDFTCTDGLAPSFVESSAVEPCFAAAGAERNKKDKYLHLSQQHLFSPVAVECLGSFGKEGLKFVKDIGKRITSLSGEKKAVTYLIQRISVAVQRGNALSVLGTIPQGLSLDDFICIL